MTECQAVLEAFKNDRTQTPTICNRELRKVCCPLKMASTTQEAVVAVKTVIESKISSDDDVDDSEVFTSSEIIKSLCKMKNYRLTKRFFLKSALNTRSCC